MDEIGQQDPPKKGPELVEVTATKNGQDTLLRNRRATGKAISFGGQVNALLRKNLTYQKRRPCLNVCLVILPLLFVGLLASLQLLINNALDSRDNKCGCACMSCCNGLNCRSGSPDDPVSCRDGEEKCVQYNDTMCGIAYSDVDQAFFCSVDHPPTWPPVLKIPEEADRARPWNPKAAMLLTGLTSASGLKDHMYPVFDSEKGLASVELAGAFASEGSEGTFRGESLSAAGLKFGTSQDAGFTGFLEPAFFGGDLSALTQDCDSFPLEEINVIFEDVAKVIAEQGRSIAGDVGNESDFLSCVQTPMLELTKEDINERLFCSFQEAYCNATKEKQEVTGRKMLPSKSPNQLNNEGEPVTDKYSSAWDFSGSDDSQLKVNIWYDDSEDEGGPNTNLRLSNPLDAAANAWVQWVLGKEYSAQTLALQEVPKIQTDLKLEFSSLLAPLFFSWVAQLMLPVMLVQMVYEKESRLRVMMKMHGLGDAAYWTINYMYYFVLYSTYMAVFVLVASVANLAVINRNSYGVLAMLFFLYGNVQITSASFLSSMFKSSTTAMIFSILLVIISGLIGEFLLRQLIERPKWYVYAIELIPSFGIYRAWYELSQYGFVAALANTEGLTWSAFSDDNNHMGFLLVAFVIEWFLFAVIAWYLEQVLDNGAGVQRPPFFFLEWFRKNPETKAAKSIASLKYDAVEKSSTVEIHSEDALIEFKRVNNMTPEEIEEQGIVVNGLQKVFPAADGNPPKVAVQDLTVAVRKGEVFGLLGPNGAGKTTSINMLIGFMSPSAGYATVSGFDISSDIQKIYTLMGVCPQHNLLWDALTGLEHLLFHGRLKGLRGDELKEGAETALKSVNLLVGGAGNKQVRTYSGGMKRRLSVAIALIGKPTAVYLDEPSTGLDPASRKNLWKVVQSAKTDKAVILTTHSMQEAEVLCDRLGIFVDGRMVILGNPKQLISRHGGYKVMTLMTKPQNVDAVRLLVLKRFPLATLTYSVSGTLKYELPSADVKHSDVFEFMEGVDKEKIQIEDWGVADATLEDVFIKVAHKAGAYSENLS